MQVGDRVAHGVGVEARLDPDRRQLDDLGAQVPQRRRQAAHLGAGARDHHRAAPERAPLDPGDRVAPGGDVPEEQDRGRAEAGLGDRGGQLGQRRGDGALAGQRATLDRRRGLGRVAAGGRLAFGEQGRFLTPM